MNTNENDERGKKTVINNSPLVLSPAARFIFSIISLVAAYMCFKINKGFSWYIIIALFFSPLYIVYALAVHGNKAYK